MMKTSSSVSSFALVIVPITRFFLKLKNRHWRSNLKYFTFHSRSQVRSKMLQCCITSTTSYNFFHFRSSIRSSYLASTFTTSYNLLVYFFLFKWIFTTLAKSSSFHLLHFQLSFLYNVSNQFCCHLFRCNKEIGFKINFRYQIIVLVKSSSVIKAIVTFNW